MRLALTRSTLSAAARLAAAGLIGVLGAGGSSARSTAPNPEAILRPDPQATVPPYVVRGRAVELQVNGVHVRVHPLGEIERAAYFALRTELGFDPLPRRADMPSGLTVFDLSFRNESGRPLRFIPAQTALRWTRDHELLPLHVDRLYSILRARLGGDGSADRAAVRALKAFHFEPLVLAHGESASRLMVYEGYPARAKELTLELGPVFVGTESVSPVMTFLLDRPEREREGSEPSGR